MYLNDLASMLRAGGMKVVEVSGWQSRNHGALRSTSSIVCHHTAGATTGNFPSLNVVTYGRADLAGPLCNLGLGRDGTVYVVSNGVAWHAGATTNDAVYGNYNAIGIEAENSGSQPWPDVQVQAYAKLCALLCKHYGIPVSRVVGHKEICSPRGRKIDPAGLPGDMAGLRTLTQNYMSGGGGSSTPSAPILFDEDDDMQPVNLEKSPGQTFKTFIWDGRKAVLNVISDSEDVFVGAVLNWGPKGGTGGGTPTDGNNLPTVPGGYRVQVNLPGQFSVPAGTTRVVLPYSTNAEGAVAQIVPVA